MAREEARAWWCEDECDESWVFSSVKFGLGGDEQKNRKRLGDKVKDDHTDTSAHSHTLAEGFFKGVCLYIQLACRNGLLGCPSLIKQLCK